MISLVILSILLSVAVPSFSRLLAEQRLREASSELRMSLSLARSEAVKRNQSVVVIPRTGGWGKGWCLESNSAATDCSSTPISEYVVDTSSTITGKDSLLKVTFNAWGRTTTCPKFELETDASGGACNVCVYVETDGRVLTTAGKCAASCPGAGAEDSWLGACD